MSRINIFSRDIFFFSVWHARLDARVCPRRGTLIAELSPLASSAKPPLAGVRSHSRPPVGRRATTILRVLAQGHLRSGAPTSDTHWRRTETSTRAAALGSDTARFSSSPSRVHVRREKKKGDRLPAIPPTIVPFPRTRVRSTVNLEKSHAKIAGHRRASAYAFIAIAKSNEPFRPSVLISAAGRGTERKKYAVHGDVAEPNGMLSGIWEVLAARSHLYATPGVASPATRSPPVASALFSLLPCRRRRRWTGNARLDLAARFSRFMFASIGVPWPFNLLADSLVKIRKVVEFVWAFSCIKKKSGKSNVMISGRKSPFNPFMTELLFKHYFNIILFR